MLEVYGDFQVPLMRVLDSLPNRTGKTKDVVRLFGITYKDQISQHQYTRNDSGHPRWEWNVQWSRMDLKKSGFMDAPRTGIWRLTEVGHKWLLEHPDAIHLNIKRQRSGKKDRVRSLFLPTNNEIIEQKTKYSNKVDLSQIYSKVNEEIESIHAYIQGLSSMKLGNEKICDWINFCYTLGLYIEGKELFSLLDNSEVNGWYYDRTKKIAKACDQKIRLLQG